MFELRDYAHDITNNLLTGFAPPALESMLNTVVSADALIAVTPIFSTSYSGLFKSFIDVIDPDALTGKPVLIGANAGTPRHSLAIDYAIRPLFAYLHAEPISTGVFAASSDWGGSGDQVAPLGERIERAATRARRGDLAALARGIRRPVRPVELPRRGPLVRPPARRPRGGVALSPARCRTARPTASRPRGAPSASAGRRHRRAGRGRRPRAARCRGSAPGRCGRRRAAATGALGRVDELGLIEDEPRGRELAARRATTRRPSRTGEGPGCRGTAGRRARGPAR